MIIPCKDDFLNMKWDDIPFSLNLFDGLEFEKKEELGRKLVGEIRGKILSKSNESLENTGHSKPVRILGIPHTNYDLDYRIVNGDILSANIDRDASSLVIGIATYGNGSLEVSIPRLLLDAKVGEQSDNLYVLLDGEETDFYEEIDEDKRKLTIHFLHPSDTIEILGTEVLGTSYVGLSTKENTIKILQKSSIPHGGPYLQPETLTIKSGEKVRWINEDNAAHTITSGQPSEGPDGSFDSSLFMSKQNFEVTFSLPGTFEYFCMVHPWKKGKIIVK